MVQKNQNLRNEIKELGEKHIATNMSIRLKLLPSNQKRACARAKVCSVAGGSK
jgi:hypothetical protein